jgi:PPOX class probable F420-dependent enzyme
VKDLGSERYVSITSFRRDGTGVATPVWVVTHDERLYVWTGAQTGKVRRIRRNPDVTVAACTIRGTVTGPPRRARAAIVAASERPEVWDLFRAKYRVQLLAITLTGRISRMLRRGSGQPADRVYLELTLAALADQLGNRHVLARRGDAHEGVEDLVVAEHRRARIGPAAAVAHGPGGVEQAAREHQCGWRHAGVDP